MTESEVRKLFLVIQNSYSGFDYDDDKVMIWVDLLREVPFPLAQKNLRAHIMNPVRPFPPTPGEISRPEPQPEQIALYHESLKESAQQHLANMNEWTKKAVGPPDEIRNMMRLPDGEREEALREYAKRIQRKLAERETAGS